MLDSTSIKFKLKVKNYIQIKQKISIIKSVNEIKNNYLSLRKNSNQSFIKRKILSLQKEFNNTNKRNWELNSNLITNDTLMTIGLLLTPHVIFIIYAYIKGKGDLKHGISQIIKDVSKGYFQMELGGPDIPICDGELKDLVSDEPLFCFLYNWLVNYNNYIHK